MEPNVLVLLLCPCVVILLRWNWSGCLCKNKHVSWIKRDHCIYHWERNAWVLACDGIVYNFLNWCLLSIRQHMINWLICGDFDLWLQFQHSAEIGQTWNAWKWHVREWSFFKWINIFASWITHFLWALYTWILSFAGVSSSLRIALSQKRMFLGRKGKVFPHLITTIVRKVIRMVGKLTASKETFQILDICLKLEYRNLGGSFWVLYKKLHW